MKSNTKTALLLQKSSHCEKGCEIQEMAVMRRLTAKILITIQVNLVLNPSKTWKIPHETWLSTILCLLVLVY